MRILGIDYGSKRIGLAIGDLDSRIATPWKILEGLNAAESVAEIGKIVIGEQIGKIVLGMPRSLRDEQAMNQQMIDVHHFGKRMESLGIPIEYMDEALSSRQAAVFVADRGEHGKRDDLAATVILQSWLDRASA